MDLDGLKKAADLDVIIDGMLENETLTPEFVKICELEAMDKIEGFTAKVTRTYGVELQELVESQAGELLDCICEANRVFFRNGMAAGAVLLMQLLGL